MNHSKLLSLSLIFLCACSQAKDPAPEPAEEVAIWASVGDGDQSFNPGNYKTVIFSANYGILSESRSWTGSAWKNDHAVSRIDIATYDESFKDVSLAVGDLTCPEGGKISSANITATFLDAINSKSEAYPDIDYEIYDVISRKTSRDLEAESLYSVWVDIAVPEGTPAGVYNGVFSLMSRDGSLADFEYSLEVFDLTLTNPEEWETFLDLWEYPFASNRYYSGKNNTEYFKYTTPEREDTNPFSLWYIHLDPQYQAGLESELELYHKAGGNAITVELVEDPHNSRLPCPTPSMVKWTRHSDGTFSYDYTDMDWWIELNLKHGIDRQIDMFYHSGVGWGFVCYDEQSGKVTNDYSAQPGTEEWRRITHDFFTDLVAHLDEKGWFDKALIYLDERLYPVTYEMVVAGEGVKNREGKTLKVGGALNSPEIEPLYDRLYDISFWENLKINNLEELAESRRAKGLQTTLYTCGSGKMSSVNNPAQAAFAVYQARKYKMDGVMRWALNKYDEDPLHGTLHTTCYPGDCYLIYPDEKDSPEMKAQSSPRFEKLCEGMRTTEKLNLIRKNHPQYAEAVDEIVASLTYADDVAQAAAMREKVRRLSAAVQAGEPAPAL